MTYSEFREITHNQLYDSLLKVDLSFYDERKNISSKVAFLSTWARVIKEHVS